MKKRLPNSIKEAVVRGRAKGEARLRQPKLEEPFIDLELIARKAAARNWVLNILPSIIEEYAAQGQSGYCIGWCTEGLTNISKDRVEACEEVGLKVIVNKLYYPKVIGEEKNLKMTMEDLRVIEYYLVAWDNV